LEELGTVPNSGAHLVTFATLWCSVQCESKNPP